MPHVNLIHTLIYFQAGREVIREWGRKRKKLIRTNLSFCPRNRSEENSWAYVFLYVIVWRRNRNEKRQGLLNGSFIVTRYLPELQIKYCLEVTYCCIDPEVGENSYASWENKFWIKTIRNDYYSGIQFQIMLTP